MSSQFSDEQMKQLCQLLVHVMGILRDDLPFVSTEPIFGSRIFKDVKSEQSWGRYIYTIPELADAQFSIETTSDPLNYSEDRSKVPIVPVSFSLTFGSSKGGIERHALEKLLSLEDFWVDSTGQKQQGNSILSLPPAIRLHTYRYRARALPGSRFPVDVDIFYIDPRSSDPGGAQTLDGFNMARSYRYLTPEMRKQKRDEQKALPWHAVPERTSDQ